MAEGGQEDLMARIPAYKQMYASLKKDIQEGKYGPGSFLPTETELERIYGVSRTTVRRAVGIFIMSAIVVVLYMVDDSVKSSDDIEKYLGLNTLTSIPLLEDEGDTQKKSGIKVPFKKKQSGQKKKDGRKK